jgi:hypothetical protein
MRCSFNAGEHSSFVLSCYKYSQVENNWEELKLIQHSKSLMYFMFFEGFLSARTVRLREVPGHQSGQVGKYLYSNVRTASGRNGTLVHPLGRTGK